MKVEQWGTFSVKDHINPRAFVAEVLLYDKLVVPRPPSLEELEAELKALSPDEARKPIQDPKDLWERQRWDPERQRELLNILGESDLAVEIPWGQRAQQDWKAIYNPDPAQQLDGPRTELRASIQQQIEVAKSTQPGEAAYLATGGLLSLYVANQLNNRVARKMVALAKTPDTTIEPVVAYSSYAEFSDDQGVKITPDQAPPVGASPHALFGWEFFVPEDSSKTDAELLRMAVKLASRPDFIEMRQYFHGWLKQMVEGRVEAEDARKKMQKLLDEYGKMRRLSGLETGARYAAKVVGTVAAPLLGIHWHTTGVEIGAGVAAATLALDWLLPATPAPARVQPASILYDGRRFFH